ncbi:DUF6519 domain-containing protein [Mycobacterium sp. 050134]|uniref:DUF6519 domain-containing protein n=1 Tax=Mycobacterium sp. 050134 TaxID=3096111 RepID=UPI002ED96457
MATDIARLSFDPERLYRGVVAQQGRVSLEAEQNEQRIIDTEERRKEIIDIVGPAGTPDNGYAVGKGSGAGFDLTIGKGTMYVGGWRVHLHAAMDTASQPDWIDNKHLQTEDPVRPGREHVVLWVQDTDVTAVEDPALYEVAVGGPDGAARTRLLQRVMRLDADDVADCAAALAKDVTTWAESGLKLHPETLELKSQSRLKATWLPDTEHPNPCEPSSTGGYLGAENQCIRVQITGVDSANGTVDFLWGYDDASFLYRVSAQPGTEPVVLTLDRAPVDDNHRPRQGQAVQALRAAAALNTAGATTEGYAAALGGVPGTVSADYNPDTKTVQVQFPTGLGPDYTDDKINPRLYLRIWQQWIQGAAVNQPITLTDPATHNDTGLQITITSSGGHALHVDDYWCIAVRPATPTVVYPDRYLNDPQPPDGPRQWVCPLAIVDWTATDFLVADCRHPFKPLIDAQCADCCTLDVHPSDAGNLQDLLDAAAGGRPASPDGRLIVCFQPGRYQLTKPLRLTAKHSNLTLRGCNNAAVLAVAAGHEAAFGLGMVQLVAINDVRITGFEFDVAQAPLTRAPAQTRAAPLTAEAQRAISTVLNVNLVTSFAVVMINCTGVEIDDCVFQFGADAGRPDEVAGPMALGAALFAVGAISGLRVTGNQFLLESAAGDAADGPAVLGGFWEVPGSSGLLSSQLDDALIAGNRFVGMTVAVGVIAMLGQIDVRENVIDDCYCGVWIVDAEAFANINFGARQVASSISDAVQQTQHVLARGMLDPVLLRLAVSTQVYPLPPPDGVELSGVARLNTADLAALREQSAQAQVSYMAKFDERLAAAHPTASASDVQQAAAQRVSTATVDSAAAIVGDRNLAVAAAGLADIARLVGFEPRVATSVRIERNSVACGPSDVNPTASAVFTVLSVHRSDPAVSAVAVDNNRLISRGTLAAGVFGGAAGTINGNTVVSEPASTEPTSTFALAVGQVGPARGRVERVAIVGNVVTGNALLPNRPQSAQPLTSWWPLNAIS